MVLLPQYSISTTVRAQVHNGQTLQAMSFSSWIQQDLPEGFYFLTTVIVHSGSADQRVKVGLHPRSRMRPTDNVMLVFRWELA